MQISFVVGGVRLCRGLASVACAVPVHQGPSATGWLSLAWHAGVAPQPHPGPYGHLAPQAAQGRQALAHGADAGGGDEPGTGGEATGGHRPRLRFRRFSAAVAGVA